jgi:hypothetical protein
MKSMTDILKEEAKARKALSSSKKDASQITIQLLMRYMNSKTEETFRWKTSLAFSAREWLIRNN